ncbi:MAG: DUF3575 domain-containing protein [Saprospiraceae bacterium]|nr:DUF3575 domain-containing protein [Saprospiraceae bacterium]
MKNVFYTLVLMLAFIGSAAAQQTQAIKVGPLGFLFGNYNARYEKALNDKSSFQVGANFFNYEILDEGVTGFGVDLGYRYYFREAIEGAYVSPAVGFDLLKTFDLNYSTLGLGATVGYQWVAGGGFVVDLGLGYGYNVLVNLDEGLNEDEYGGGGVRFTFALGYAF